MFHVKRFGTIGAEILTKPHTASRLSTCAIAPKTPVPSAGDGRIASPVGDPGFVDEFETLNHWSVRTHAHRIDKKASYAKS
jgi:hypothetical protein